MLEFLRKGVQSWFFKGLLLLLVASFAIWGIGDPTIGTGSGNAVATVGDVEIPGPRLLNAYQVQMNRLRGAITPEQAQSLGLVNNVLESLVNETLYEAEALDMGVTATQAELLKILREERAFRNQLGQFDRIVFEQVLAQNGLNEQTYVDGLRRDLQRQQVLSSLTGNFAPKPAVERLFAYTNEARVADVFTIPVDKSVDVGEPNADELKKYHEENAAAFTAPEYRSAEVIYLKPDDVKGEISVSEQELAELYKERLESLTVPERRTVLQMVLVDDKAAADAQAQLATGKDFMEVAKDVAAQDKTSTELGDITKDDLPAELANAVFALPKDTNSASLKGPFGTHVFRVTAITPAVVKTFEEAKQGIKDEIVGNRAVNALFELSETLDDTLGGGATLAEAASQLKLKLTKIDAIDNQGLDRAGNAIGGLPPGRPFLDALFSGETGQTSPLQESGHDGFFVYRVDSVTPSGLIPLDQIKDKAIAQWKEDKYLQAARDKAQQLIDQLKEGKTFDALAKANGVTAVTSKPFLRDGTNAAPDVPNRMVPMLFSLQKNEAAFTETARGIAIAYLKDIQAADAGKAPDALKQMKEEVERGVNSDLIVQFGNALRKRHPVSVNQRAVDALVAVNPAAN